MKTEVVVKEILADVLGISSDDIHLEKGFEELGLTPGQKEEVVADLVDGGFKFVTEDWGKVKTVQELVSFVTTDSDQDLDEDLDDSDDFDDDNDDWEDDDDEDDDDEDDDDEDDDDDIDDSVDDDDDDD